jgi:hypothetical protein
MKRMLIFTSVLLVLAAWAFWGYTQWKMRSFSHIPVQGGRPLSIRLPIEGAHFMQNDPKWGADKIGGSEESIRAVGCAICSVATAARALGEKTDPAIFNRELIAAGGYTPQGWLVWSAAAKVFENRIYDPLVNTSEPIPFSQRASSIYSVRIVKRG